MLALASSYRRKQELDAKIMLNARKSHLMHLNAHPPTQALLGFHSCANDRPQRLNVRVRPWQGWGGYNRVGLPR